MPSIANVSTSSSHISSLREKAFSITDVAPFVHTPHAVRLLSIVISSATGGTFAATSAETRWRIALSNSRPGQSSSPSRWSNHDARSCPRAIQCCRRTCRCRRVVISRKLSNFLANHWFRSLGSCCYHSRERQCTQSHNEVTPEGRIQQVAFAVIRDIARGLPEIRNVVSTRIHGQLHIASK